MSDNTHDFDRVAALQAGWSKIVLLGFMAAAIGVTSWSGQNKKPTEAAASQTVKTDSLTQSVPLPHPAADNIGAVAQSLKLKF